MLIVLLLGGQQLLKMPGGAMLIASLHGKAKTPQLKLPVSEALACNPLLKL